MSSLDISDYKKKLSFSNEVSKLVNLIQKGENEINISGANASFKRILITTLFEQLDKQIFIIVKDTTRANYWVQDFSLLKVPNIIELFEPQNRLKLKIEGIDQPQTWLSDALSQIISTQKFVSITTPDILKAKVPKPDSINAEKTKIVKGETIDYNKFCNRLLLNGFDKKDYVSSPGDIAFRGGIIDIFPVGWQKPIRIELWDNFVDSIRMFEPLTQRSIQDLNEVEFIASVFLPSKVEDFTEIKSYLSANSLIVFDDYDEIIQYSNINTEELTNQKIILNCISKPSNIEFKTFAQPNFNSSAKNLIFWLEKYYNDGYFITIASESDIHTKRLQDIISNAIEYQKEKNPDDLPLTTKLQSMYEHINWENESLTEGFWDNNQKLVYFTEHQIFNRQKYVAYKQISKKDQILSLKELKQWGIGNLVVHEDRGIAIFDGFQTVKLGDSYQDCIRLRFADDDILYVNLNYIHKIQKYTAQEGVAPKLSKLGSNDWQRKKQRVKSKLKDIARDLIKLYAKRRMQEGFSYIPDTPWQKEFEASFIYEDTPDQAKATEEIKNDMAQKIPMDRLICGDVGYGKTEVAIRASFIAVQSGKQVAVLVPTTILAEQHYTTFSERFKNYPVNVEVISRFKSAKEQKTILEKLKKGQVDIIIGTHRLLSKDVEFKDLGLLIIDEEHLFGVTAKEKLRQMRVNIDTLSLTATPIPRTLNFSLMGARDLSIIETPPRNRLPIITEIVEWNDDFIKEKILYELKRQGQCYFVNNKIEDIYNLAERIQRIVPEAKILVAHGQMPARQLENVMKKFISQQADILVSTKIIESGIDLPRVNTIFINRAHSFGLAELYQLRGRVGRSNIQAYCYLIIPPVKTISTNALKRLQAIEEFTELGSGLQLALRDMEIRGAGNLLGAEQSGFINDLGYEQFQKILDEAVTELRKEEFGELFAEKIDTKAELLKNDGLLIEYNLDAFIPPDYIQMDAERFLYYKKLYNASSNSELLSIQEEITDRYGKPPREFENLCFVVKLRINAMNTGIRKIKVAPKKATLELPPMELKEYYDFAMPILIDFVNSYENTYFSDNKKSLYLTIEYNKTDELIEKVWRIKKMLQTENN